MKAYDIRTALKGVPELTITANTTEDEAAAAFPQLAAWHERVKLNTGTKACEGFGETEAKLAVEHETCKILADRTSGRISTETDGFEFAEYQFVERFFTQGAFLFNFRAVAKLRSGNPLCP